MFVSGYWIHWYKKFKSIILSSFKLDFCWCAKALKSITVEFRSIKEIGVETETDNEASPEDSLVTHQAYNRFMESVTGFNAKQRVDRAKARAKKEAKAAAEKEMQS